MVNASLPTTRADISRRLTLGSDRRADWDQAYGEHARALENRDRFEKNYPDTHDATVCDCGYSVFICLDRAEVDLERRMVATPASDLAALGAKLEAVFRPENHYNRDWTCEECAAVLADVRRLIPAGIAPASQ